MASVPYRGGSVEIDYQRGYPVLVNTAVETAFAKQVAEELVGPQRVIGSVVYPAVEIDAPGVVRHIDGKRFALGEPDGILRRLERAFT